MGNFTAELRKMRCIIIQPYVAPYRYDFFRMLAGKIDLKVLYLWPTPGVDESEETLQQKLGACQVKRLTGGLTIKGYYAIRFQLKKEIESFNPDWVITHEYNTISLQVWLLQKLFYKKWRWGIWSSDNAMMAVACSGLRRRARDFFAGRCDELLLYSGSVKDEYQKILPFTKDKILICPNLQSTSRLREEADAALRNLPYPEELEQLAEKKIFLYVGRLAAEKNLPGMIRAFALAEVPDSVLVIVGEGHEKEKLIRTAYDCGVEKRIVFAGKKTGMELLRFYLAADLFLLVSKRETFGAVVNEALALGVPVVLSENTGAKELINQHNGCLVQPENVADISQKIATMAAGIERGDKSRLRPALIPDLLPWYVDEFIRVLSQKVNDK